MSESGGSPTLLFSELAGDPELDQLVTEFVAALAERVSALEQVLAAGNLARAATLAHQLKGAAGSYGFPLITEAALRVERIAKEGRNVGALRDAVTDLAQLCRRAQPPGG